MRLNKTQKETMIEKALNDILTERFENLKKNITQLADDVYQYEYGEESDAIDALKLKHNWSPSYSSSACLKLNGVAVYWGLDKVPAYQSREAMGKIERRFCSHYDGDEVTLSEARRFPPHDANEIHVDLASHKRRLEKLRDECKALVAEEKELKGELELFMAAIKTRQQLIDNWPEGEKYLPVVEKKNLPIPLIDNVRKAMNETA